MINVTNLTWPPFYLLCMSTSASEEDDIGSDNDDDDDSNDLEEPMKFDDDDALCPYPGELLGEDLLNAHYSVQDATRRMVNRSQTVTNYKYVIYK